MKRNGIPRLVVGLLAAVTIFAGATTAASAAELVRGQLLYVPCSSHIYQGVKTRPFDLTVTLLVRNADPWRKLVLTHVEYHASDGRLLRRMVAAPITLSPLATREFVVEQNDAAGGAGASFLVRWRAASAAMNAPVVEAVMIGTSNNQGLSFTSRGVAVHE